MDRAMVLLVYVFYSNGRCTPMSSNTGTSLRQNQWAKARSKWKVGGFDLTVTTDPSCWNWSHGTHQPLKISISDSKTTASFFSCERTPYCTRSAVGLSCRRFILCRRARFSAPLSSFGWETLFFSASASSDDEWIQSVFWQQSSLVSSHRHHHRHALY